MKLSKFKILSLTLSLASSLAFASSTIEYKTNCRYIDPHKKLRYAGQCMGNFGITGADPKAPLRYIMTFPNKSEITVFIYENELALINDIPAKRINSPKGSIHLLTGQNEEFTFGTPPPDSM